MGFEMSSVDQFGFWLLVTATDSVTPFNKGPAKDRAPLKAIAAVLLTMSTVSKAASLTAPMAPFSRISWTVSCHSCLIPSSKLVAMEVEGAASVPCGTGTDCEADASSE